MRPSLESCSKSGAMLPMCSPICPPFPSSTGGAGLLSVGAAARQDTPLGRGKICASGAYARGRAPGEPHEPLPLPALAEHGADGLTDPSARYRLQVAVMFVSIGAFIVFYLALCGASGWLLWQAIRYPIGRIGFWTS